MILLIITSEPDDVLDCLSASSSRESPDLALTNKCDGLHWAKIEYCWWVGLDLEEFGKGYPTWAKFSVTSDPKDFPLFTEFLESSIAIL